MSVGSWSPEGQEQNLPDDRALACMLTASSQSAENNFGLSTEEIDKYAALMQIQLSSWSSILDGLSAAELVGLLKFFTLAEQHLKGWQAGASSPVIAIAKLLREQSAYPDDLTIWIRANSNNRFLPHGNLMDRL